MLLGMIALLEIPGTTDNIHGNIAALDFAAYFNINGIEHLRGYISGGNVREEAVRVGILMSAVRPSCRDTKRRGDLKRLRFIHG